MKPKKERGQGLLLLEKQMKAPSPKKPEIQIPQKPEDPSLLKVRYKKRNLKVKYAKL